MRLHIPAGCRHCAQAETMLMMAPPAVIPPEQSVRQASFFIERIAKTMLNHDRDRIMGDLAAIRWWVDKLEKEIGG